MTFFQLASALISTITKRQFWQHLVKVTLVTLFAVSSSFCFFNAAPALANLNDDKYDGNVFILYAGNGSLVPPRLTLAESLQRKKPALLVFYVDDSSDCKQFSVVVSQLQAYYGKTASLIPIAVDSLPVKSNYNPDEPGYYYEGVVPQTVLINQEGKVVFNGKGQVSFEAIDDVFREVFDLLPRSESAELKLRSFNEYNAELTNQ